jgi:general secretion pathway protein F
MPNFRYNAITQAGERVSGLISAPSAAEVAYRIDYLRLVPIGDVVEERTTAASRFDINFGRRARSEDITAFTLDLALLLKAGARLDDALELLASAGETGRLRPTIGKIRASVISGESFADALSHHPTLFSPIYVALTRVGEASGTLDRILEMLAGERARAETLRRKIADALRYPAFVLFAAGCVLTFFLMFVMPQFGAVLRDFGGKLDPSVLAFLALSEFLNVHKDLVGLGVIVVLLAGLFVAWQPKLRATWIAHVSRAPGLNALFALHRTALFCRNLNVLLVAGIPLTTTLRILVDVMDSTGHATVWSRTAEKVRQGGKLSDTLGETAMLPAMAVRMLRLGEETGQLPALAGRIAEFYETKLQRNLDRAVGIVGPLAIIIISIIVGGLIVSVMTSLLSVSQIVG